MGAVAGNQQGGGRFRKLGSGVHLSGEGHGSPERCCELQGSRGRIQSQLTLEAVLW